MKRNWIIPLAFAALIYLPGALIAQPPDITADELEGHVTYLAGDDLKGRKAGKAGGRKAAEYIREQFRNYGLELMMDEGFQKFELINAAEAGPKNLLKVNGDKAMAGDDFNPVSFSANKQLSAEVVFAGYGFDIDKDTLQWHDYQGIDAEGKWVMMFGGDPEPDNPHSPFVTYAMPRSKVVTAEDHNAGGVLFITPEGMNEKDQLPGIFYDKTATKSEIPVLTITRALADKMLAGQEMTVSRLEKKLTEEREPHSFETETKVKARADVILEKAVTQNVMARIRASQSEEYIVIGAHYDHLGMGGPGSGSRKPDTTAVHNGADDNASGTAGVIELAGKLQHEKATLRRNIIFVAFGAEEMGLLGSKHFVANMPVPKEKVVAMVNFDMIGRLDPEDKALSIGGTGTAREFEELLKANVGDAGFTLKTSKDGYGPSDHAAFYAEDIPVLFVSTGAHGDYHTPADDAGMLDYQAQEVVVQYVYRLAKDLAGEQQLTFQKSGSKNKTSRTRLKVTFGIIPDYSGKVEKGLGVDGVKEGGSADKGGMKKGDVITAIEGKPVGDIYEYMHRLQDLESGQTVSVDVLRDGKEKVLILQL